MAGRSHRPIIFSMPPHDIVVIGASSGGVDAVMRVASAFPKDFSAAVFIVVHVSPMTPSILPQILARSSRIPALHPSDGDEIQPGRIYVAPPDRHLLLTRNQIEVTSGPRENHHRPSIDVLFRSAAATFGPRVIGVVLTGALDDGAAGLWYVSKRGGLAVVQDPSDAHYPSMPQAAIDMAAPHHVLKLDAIGPNLVELVAQRLREPPPPARQTTDIEVSMQHKGAGDIDAPPGGAPSQITCPECGGTLFENQEGNNVRFRCYTGHAFSPEALFEDKFDGVERALWTALRALEESSLIARRLANRARGVNRQAQLLRYEEKIRETEAGATVLKDLLRRRRKAAS
jgi:two-component system, chemotaxis family, protein-glutamate methylesterase/glutaminase